MNFKKDKKIYGELDELDLNIIRLLQKDSRVSCRSIGKTLNASAGTISERIKRLTESGVIRKFTTIIDPIKVGKLYTMLLLVRLNSQYRPDDVVKKIEKLDGSCCIQNITGNYQLHLLVRTADNHSAADLLDKIRAIEGIDRVNSYVVLRSFKAFYDVSI